MSRVESPEELRDAVLQRAGDAGQRVAQAADDVGGRITQRVADATDDVGGRLTKRTDRAAVRSGVLGIKTGTRVGAAGTKVGIKGSKLGARGLWFGAKAGAREKLRPATDAKLKAQLARTSRELANETSDLGEVVDSLNTALQENRRAGAAGRTRLILGIALGAVAAYHLDAQQGAQRRAATVRRIRSLVGARPSSRMTATPSMQRHSVQPGDEPAH